MRIYRIKVKEYFSDVEPFDTLTVYSVQVRGLIFWHTIKTFTTTSCEDEETQLRAKWDAEELYKMLIEDGRP